MAKENAAERERENKETIPAANTPASQEIKTQPEVDNNAKNPEKDNGEKSESSLLMQVVKAITFLALLIPSFLFGLGGPKKLAEFLYGTPTQVTPGNNKSPSPKGQENEKLSPLPKAVAEELSKEAEKGPDKQKGGFLDNLKWILGRGGEDRLKEQSKAGKDAANINKETKDLAPSNTTLLVHTEKEAGKEPGKEAKEKGR